MSIVTVHGPNTMYSKAVVGNASGSAYATVNPANGLIWTFQARDQSQVAANYDWAYTGAAGTPTSPINDTKAPVVTLPAGQHTVTLTLNGVAQPSFVINAVAGVAPLMQEGEGGDNVGVQEFVHEGQRPNGSVVEPEPDAGQASGGDGDGDNYDPNAPDQDYSLEVGYDPAAHTVTEVIGYVEDNPDQLDAIMEAERAGKERVTLLNHLESMRESSS